MRLEGRRILLLSFGLAFFLMGYSGRTATPRSSSAREWPVYPKTPFIIKLEVDPPATSAGSLVACDVDSDGLMDYLITQPGRIAAYAHPGNRLWIKKADIQVGSSSETAGLPGHHGPGVQAGDVDGDGRVEVLFLTKDGSLNILDGKNGREKRKVVLKSPPGSERWEHVVIANFRGKGDRDILLQATNKDGYRMGRYLAAYSLDDLSRPLWTMDSFIPCAHNGARIADVDGDGKDEVPGPVFVDHDGKTRTLFEPRGHLDSIYIYDVQPDKPGLEVVALEEGPLNRVFLFNKDGLIWETHYEHQEPQNAAVGRFRPGTKGLQIWCRSRYDTHQKPFLLDCEGKLLSHYEMDMVAPAGWTEKGVETINVIDWTGDEKQLAVAKERHTSGDVGIFDPDGGRFIKRFKEKADRLYVADVAGDWREEIIVLNGRELHIYQNTERNPNPQRPRLWNQQHYRRSKMTWNYYSP